MRARVRSALPRKACCWAFPPRAPALIGPPRPSWTFVTGCASSRDEAGVSRWPTGFAHSTSISGAGDSTSGSPSTTVRCPNSLPGCGVASACASGSKGVTSAPKSASYGTGDRQDNGAPYRAESQRPLASVTDVGDANRHDQPVADGDAGPRLDTPPLALASLSNLNRRVRPRRLGGVGRAVSNDRPYPIRPPFLFLVAGS